MKSSSTLRVALLLFVFLGLLSASLQAQIDPTLSIQGILKKASGVAVNDGNYAMTFKLYTVATGGTPIWEEPQNSVEVSSGIYSAVLGAQPAYPLNLPFNQIYYLGVTVGSTELTPRTVLTSAPYALSLIGVTNKFPSSGAVRADSMRVATNLAVGANLPTSHSVVVTGGFLGRGGTPGANGVNNNGYAFSGNSGDNDSGLFSTADGNVSLYSNSLVLLTASLGSLTVTGTLNADHVEIENGSLMYNGQSNWRLVETNYFEGGDNQGWQFSNPDAGQTHFAFKNSIAGDATAINYGDMAGWVLKPTSNDQVFKKQFSPAGSFNFIKVVFKFYAIGNWDFGDGASAGFAAFSNNPNGSDIRLGWDWHPQFASGTYNYDNDPFRAASSFDGIPANTSDQWTTGEMIGKHSGPFWVFFGYANDENETTENFAIGGIEIWVK